MVDKKTTATSAGAGPVATENSSSTRPLTLVDKEHRLLLQAKIDLADCQKQFIEKLVAISDRIVQHKMNLEWLKQNPMAEEVFIQFLDREIAASRPDETWKPQAGAGK